MERIHVNGEQRAVVFRSEPVNYFHQLLASRGFGEGFYGAIFVVGNIEPVKEVAEKVLMGTDEPYLEDVGGHRVILAAANLLSKPGELFGPGLFFEKHRAQVSGFCQGL